MDFDHRRIGQFLLPTEFVEKEPIAVMGLLQQVIPLRVEHRFENHSFHYIAYSPEFRVIDKAQEPPYYDLRATILPDNDGFVFSFMHQPGQNQIVRLGQTFIEEPEN